MISYVLLVVIAIVMSIVVFSYLRFVANVEPVIDCQEGTSLIIEDYVCSSEGRDRITLTMRNNGRFNVKGFASTFGGNALQEPTVRILTTDSGRLNPIDGSYTFENSLKPGEIVDVNFGIEDINKIQPDSSFGEVTFSFLKKIKIQPIVYDNEADLDVPCSNAIIRQDIQDCQIKEFSLLSRSIGEYTLPDTIPNDPDDPNFQTALEEHLDEEGITTLVPTPSVYYEFEDNLLDTMGNADIQQSFPFPGLQKYTEGYLGKGVDFDGEYNLRTRRQSINNDLSRDALTISFWLKKESDSGIIMRKGIPGGFDIQLNDSKIAVRVAYLGGEPLLNCDKDLTNQWTSVVLTAARGGMQRIYINGELCVEGPVGGSVFLKFPKNLFIGNVDVIAKMDEIKFWKQELTSEEVASLYSSYVNN